MALFKRVQRQDQMIVGHKYIDEERHKIYVLYDQYGVNGCYYFHDVDDEEDRCIMDWHEIRRKLRVFNLSDLELRTLLCSSMIDFINIMLVEKNKPNKE